MESSFTQISPGSSEDDGMYSVVLESELRVMERIGTRAAAVPAAITSVKVGSSSYLICEGKGG